MKSLLLLFSLSIAYAQPSLTLVTQTVRDASGQLVTGSCVYQALSRFLAVDGSQIVGEPVTVSFTNGAFSALIVPTDTAVPGTQYYSVKCTGRRGWSRSGNWIVATSGAALHWQDIWTASPPAPGILIPPPQIDAHTLATGTYCFSVVSGVVQPVLVLCSGGGGAVLFDSATGLFDSAAGLFDAH